MTHGWIGPIGHVVDIQGPMLTLNSDGAAGWLRPGDWLHLATSYGGRLEVRHGSLVVERAAADWCRVTTYVTAGVPSACVGDVVLLWGRAFCVECHMPHVEEGDVCDEKRCAWHARIRAVNEPVGW